MSYSPAHCAELWLPLVYSKNALQLNQDSTHGKQPPSSLLPHAPAFRFYINENCNFETPQPNDMNMDMAKGFTTFMALGYVFGG